jgi:hypothetical protein
MHAQLDPAIPVVYLVAGLFQNGRSCALTTVKCIDDGEGGYRPGEDIRFAIAAPCSPTHVTVCGRTISLRHPPALNSGDTFTVQITAIIRGFVNPFRDFEL